MVAEIIAIGTEILLGDIVNTNTQYLARGLANLGVSLYHQSVIGDNPERLKVALHSALERSDLVITTGGLGPTQDDLSKEIAAEYFNKQLIMDHKALKHIEDFFARRKGFMNENNKKQALIPEGGQVLYNNHGTAPGILFDEKGKVLVMLPGPPREMKPMFDTYIVPYLEERTGNYLVSKVLKIFGIGEGHMEEKILDLINQQSNPTIAPYAKEGEVIIRLTASGSTKEEARDIIQPIKEEIYRRLGDFIYGEDDETLEEVVGKLLLEKKMTIATAESCTGGMVSETLINYPGISGAYLEGFITYSNKAKIKYLGVSEETLKEHGAVSEETAIEMVQGLLKNTGAQVGIAVTGIAGPGGGTSTKPVGLIYIGIALREQVKVIQLNTVGNRQKNRRIATTTALNELRKLLEKL